MHDGIRELFEVICNSDLAVVGADELSPLSGIVKYLPRRGDEIAQLQQLGAVGDVLGHFIRPDGSLVEHALNDRVVAVNPATLSSARKIVLASGGWSKYAVTCGALKLLRPHVLITDEVCALNMAAE